MANRMMKWFTWNHLAVELQGVGRECALFAQDMDGRLVESPEKTAGMRKLLEAKDCFVRAEMEGSVTGPGREGPP